MSDSQFLQCVNLRHPAMREAASLVRHGRTRAAAREAARAMFAAPLAHPVREADIPALAGIINRRWPGQVQWLRRLADNYLLVEAPATGLVCGADPEEEHALYRSCDRTWKRRGESIHALARLYRLSGDRRYLDAAIEHLRTLIASMPAFPEGEHVGAFEWHPFNGVGSHDPGHAAEKICHALPYLRADLSSGQALLLAKALLALAEVCYRTCRFDVTHNITLHMLCGPLLVGLCLPALKPAAEWVDFIQKRLEGDFAGRAFVTRDGYFGEGFAYQAVNHNLIQVCLRYLLASGRPISPALRKAGERSFEFAAAITRTDGHCPAFADAQYQNIHEHYIQMHEMLHYAATFWRRADFKAAAGSAHNEEPLEYNVWLMGLEGLAWWDGVEAPPRRCRPMRPHDFRASGLQFFGLGTGLNGHSGMFACAATHNHAHHDFGSIDLYGLGRGLLTDTSVTSYEEDSFRSERAHNTVVLVRRRPLGPRLDRPDHVRTLFVVRTAQIQAACMEHDLYEVHRIRRTVCLIDAGAVVPAAASRARPAAGSDAPDVPAFWLVIDRVERSYPYPSSPEPHEFLETCFHFNAPQTQLGCREKTLTAWSRFDPDGCELLRHPATDVKFVHEAQRVALKDHLRAYELVTSDANLQVTAIGPSRNHSIMDMRQLEGFTGEYGGRIKRPSLIYRWRGLLPFEAAYVLVPFRGVLARPYAPVTGRWARPGDLTVTVQLPQGRVQVHAKGLVGRSPNPVFVVRAARPAMAGAGGRGARRSTPPSTG